MPHSKVSLPVIRRLPRYYRYITELHESGVTRISSSQLSEIMGSTPSQVRQDFNCFGGFGQQGVGYSIETLQKEIHNLIFPNSQNLKAVLIGAGKLGSTITNFVINEAAGVNLVATFDKDKQIVGTQFHNMTVFDIENITEYCETVHVDILIICTPRESAKDLASIVTETGVKGIWNFSHYDFSVYDNSLTVENVHLRDSLMALSFRVSHRDKEI